MINRHEGVPLSANVPSNDESTLPKIVGIKYQRLAQRFSFGLVDVMLGRPVQRIKKPPSTVRFPSSANK